MTDYSAVFQSLLVLQEDQFDNAFDHAPLELVKEVNIAFWVITRDRNQRLDLIATVVGRKILSTYDLSVGEAHALLKLLDQPEFVTAMKQEV